nr:retrotransposon protein, putative, Ty1-copia subclass [Tanacetum cinerariifolium]
MASEQSSSGPALHEMTPATISSELMPNATSSTPFVPPSRTDWDMMFQSLFDELLTPLPSVDHPAPEVITPIAETYKDALTQSCWIEAMQKELNEFERLEVWELIPRPDKVMVITLNWIYKVKLDELGGILKNKARQLDGFVDPDNLNHVYKLKRALYGLKQAPRAWSKHIDIRYHFIKKHVKNGVIELYFVNTEYQLADIFTKSLSRERIEFLINKLGIRSFTPKTLKQLADEVEE